MALLEKPARKKNSAGGLTYSGSGVDREAADRFVERIAGMSKSTLNKRVKASVGGYASLYELDSRRWLAASTDGVGTKLKLAFSSGNHRTVGIDLVAMSVNDLLCVGAEPLFFLDYFATGKLHAGVADQVLEGIVEGCRQAGCALVGGETAEMPDFYREGEYDLGGFAVGLVDPQRALPRVKGPQGVQVGDTLIAVASSGCHSNGYSLLRRLLEKESPARRATLEPLLLAPTRIYARSLRELLVHGKGQGKGIIKGLAHITGSGFLNVPRISDKVSYELTLPSRAQAPEIYQWVREASGLPSTELAQTFNLGVGLVIVVDPKNSKKTLAHLRRRGESAWIAGQVVKRGKVGSEVHLQDGAERFSLKY